MTVTALSEHLMRIVLVGRLDTPGTDRVETRLIAHLSPGEKNALIDVSGVDFVSSMGIRMLVSAAKIMRTRQRTLAMFGAQVRVLQIFEAATLQQIMPICATEAEALVAITPSE